MKIYEDILTKSIRKVEEDNTCSIHKGSAIKLIEKFKNEYVKGSSSEVFRNLVEECAKGLELPYKYQRVAFSYLPKDKTRREKEEGVKNVKEKKVTSAESEDSQLYLEIEDIKDINREIKELHYI